MGWEKSLVCLLWYICALEHHIGNVISQVSTELFCVQYVMLTDKLSQFSHQPFIHRLVARILLQVELITIEISMTNNGNNHQCMISMIR